MTHAFLLAWRYVSYYRGRSATVAVAVGLVLLLPLSVDLLVDRFSASRLARARATPLVAGAKGSRYDLVLNALYFEGRVRNATSMAQVVELRAGDLADPIPVHARQKAKGYPVVGTSLEYFEMRGLTLAAGTPPLVLGDCVIGSRVAQDLGLGPGDSLPTDPGNLYDLTLSYPLKMFVCGVLAQTGTADDSAVLVDLKTAWLAEGVGHGHEEAAVQEAGQVLETSDGQIALNASIREFTEVTEDNVAGFHFHGEPEDFPLTAVIVIPRNDKATTLLKGRYRVSKTSQLLVPETVVSEILGFLLQVKRFFDANFALVSIATGLFLALIVLLNLQVRRREMETLHRIGCARSMVVRLVVAELAITLGAGCAGALALALVLVEVLSP